MVLEEATGNPIPAPDLIVAEAVDNDGVDALERITGEPQRSTAAVDTIPRAARRVPTAEPEASAFEQSGATAVQQEDISGSPSPLQYVHVGRPIGLAAANNTSFASTTASTTMAGNNGNSGAGTGNFFLDREFNILGALDVHTTKREYHRFSRASRMEGALAPMVQTISTPRGRSRSPRSPHTPRLHMDGYRLSVPGSLDPRDAESSTLFHLPVEPGQEYQPAAGNWALDMPILLPKTTPRSSRSQPPPDFRNGNNGGAAPNKFQQDVEVEYTKIMMGMQQKKGASPAAVGGLCSERGMWQPYYNPTISFPEPPTSFQDMWHQTRNAGAGPTAGSSTVSSVTTASMARTTPGMPPLSSPGRSGAQVIYRQPVPLPATSLEAAPVIMPAMAPAAGAGTTTGIEMGRMARGYQPPSVPGVPSAAAQKYTGMSSPLPPPAPTSGTRALPGLSEVGASSILKNNKMAEPLLTRLGPPPDPKAAPQAPVEHSFVPSSGEGEHPEEHKKKKKEKMHAVPKGRGGALGALMMAAAAIKDQVGSDEESDEGGGKNFFTTMGEIELPVWVSVPLNYIIFPIIDLILFLWFGILWPIIKCAIIAPCFVLFKVLNFIMGGSLDLAYCIYGIALAFFGGEYHTATAAIAAFKMAGGDDIFDSIGKIKDNIDELQSKSAEHDAVDADGDGVADVLEESNRQYVAKKFYILFEAMDPWVFTEAIMNTYWGILGVLLTVKCDVAAYTALGVSMSTLMGKIAAYALTPYVLKMVSKGMRRWVHTFVKFATVAICLGTAFCFQDTTYKLQSSLNGGVIFAESALIYWHRNIRKGEDEFDLDTTMVDEYIGWSLAVVGAFYQFSPLPSHIPPPYNLLLLPLLLVTELVNWLGTLLLS
ncbi:unnamed protein product [Amoebophrya sp. A25]|nr:unnamed protein product [Amoebophrya sp. A25]|eukprot:GSA25T00014176001.1